MERPEQWDAIPVARENLRGKQQVLDTIKHVYSELEKSQAQTNFETGWELIRERSTLKATIKSLQRLLSETTGKLNATTRDADLLNATLALKNLKVSALSERIKFMEKKVSWLKGEPNGNNLSYWQKLVVQEILQGYEGECEKLKGKTNGKF